MGVHFRMPQARSTGSAAVPAARAMIGCVPVLGVVVLGAALMALPGSPAAARVIHPAPAAGPPRTDSAARSAGPADAGSSSDLYVDNASGCSDTGSGTEAQPFCTIAAAAAIVQPGQTVIVEPGAYDPTTISVSGTSSAPITFLAADTGDGTVASIGLDSEVSANALAVEDSQNVVISGFAVEGYNGGDGILVDNSSDITINGGAATSSNYSNASYAAIGVEASTNVTISRLAVTSLFLGVFISNDTGAVVTANTVDMTGPGPAVEMEASPGTDITGNTIVTPCSTAVVVNNAPANVPPPTPITYLENNIVETAGDPAHATPCSNPEEAIAFSVAGASVPQTVANYNLIDPASGGPLYSWGGTSYTSLASFTAATGQGANDVAASPGLSDPPQSYPIFWYPPSAASPAIDSADANAPGELPTDQLGDPRADDPAVPNTGTGPGYYDRGAVEVIGGITSGNLTAQPDPAGGPLDVTATMTPMTSTWTTNGPIGTNEFVFSDGSLPALTSESTISHVFSTAGEEQVTIHQSSAGYLWADPSGLYVSESAVVVAGANYTPVTPTRILDTRSGIGAAKGAIAPGADLTLPIGSIGQVSASDISAIVANVTVTGPTAEGWLSVYPGASTALTGTSNINFAANQTIADLVTVQPSGGDISFHNGSTGTVQVFADLQGYYSNSGSGFQGLTPTRVLDTRSKIGTTAAGPVAAHGTVRLNLSGKVPAGVTAAVMNLTVTQPKDDGVIVAYADGQPLPGTSNLNFVPGQTIPNQVVVPLTSDVADFYNDSTGTVQLIADLNGYYSSGGPDSLVPYGPVRIVDTRDGTGVTHAGAVPADSTLPLDPDLLCPGNFPCPVATGAVLNVTVTEPQAAGALVVYPDTGAVPGTSSVNFSAGETIANLVTVQAAAGGGIGIYNLSSGSVQILVDQQGYFIDQQ